MKFPGKALTYNHQIVTAFLSCQVSVQAFLAALAAAVALTLLITSTKRIFLKLKIR